MSEQCRCGRRLIRVSGDGALGVTQVAAMWRDANGRTCIGPSRYSNGWAHLDNTPACEEPR